MICVRMADLVHNLGISLALGGLRALGQLLLCPAGLQLERRHLGARHKGLKVIQFRAVAHSSVWLQHAKREGCQLYKDPNALF